MVSTKEDVSFTQTVYKKDSKDRLRHVTITAQGHLVCQESGLLDGKATQHWSFSKAKNIGKKNETTKDEQAILDAKAKVAKKLKGEYFETIEEAANTIHVSPMLAYEAEKHIDKIDFSNGDVFVQPKLDGMRCVKDKSSMKSRQNRDIETLPDIAALLPELDGVLDGELYAHGSTFQEVMKMVKKVNPETDKVRYHVYDMISDEPFVDRFSNLIELVKQLGPGTKIRIVPTFPVESLEEIEMCHARFLQSGYEGTMIRWGNEGYEIGKRSKHLLKYKDFKDIACKVVDVIPSEKRPELGVVHCEIGPGEATFGCGMKFSHEERAEILANKDQYIGKMAEIRYFEDTDDGLPRFPVCVGFRLDK
jgi:DNA ligase-1